MKQRHQDLMQLAQSCTVGKRQNWDLNLERMTPKPSLLTILLVVSTTWEVFVCFCFNASGQPLPPAILMHLV